MSVEDAAPATLDPANHFAGNATSAPQGAKSEPLRLERRKLHRPKRSVPATTESRANSHDDAQAGFGGQCTDDRHDATPVVRVADVVQRFESLWRRHRINGFHSQR